LVTTKGQKARLDLRQPDGDGLAAACRQCRGTKLTGPLIFDNTGDAMANVTGTNGNDFVHVLGDGLTVPPGYTDNPGATDGDDFITLLDGDDIAHAGLGHDTVFLDEALPYYDIFFHADTTWNVTARFGTTDGDKELHGVEEIAFLTGTASVDVSDPGVGRVRTGSGADTITLSGNVIGGVAQNWLSVDRGLFGGDLNTLTFESFGALNLNTGGGNDSVTIGIIYGLGWTPFTDSSANPQIAPPLTVDLGAGDDALDLTNLEFSSFDPDTLLFSSLAPDPGRFHLLAGASAVQVRMGAGNDTVDGGVAVTGSITVADNRIGGEDPGVDTVNLTGGVGNWIDASSLGFGAGEQGVSVTLSEPGGPGTGLLTSSIAGHQTTMTGISNVRASSGNDTVTANSTANIVDLGTGTDHADLAGQEAARFDMVAFSGANDGLAIDLAAGTASGGTGSGLVNATFTGAEGAFGSNFADTIDCSAANDFIFGLGGNDTTDCGDGDSDIVGFTGLFDQYQIVQNPDGSFTVSDLRTPAELPVGVVSDGVDTCSNVEFLRFADEVVCVVPAGRSSDFYVNASDRRTGLMPERIVGRAGENDKVTCTLEDTVDRIEITRDDDELDLVSLIFAAAGSFSVVQRHMEHVEYRTTSERNVEWDVFGDLTGVIAGETITLSASNGDDHMDASGITSNHRVVMNAGGGTDTLLGGAGADILNGGAGNDMLSGGSNSDTLNGGADNDTMAGGGGNDIYIVASAGDVTTENANEGADTVRSYINWTLGANIERLELLGSAASGDGNGLNNSIVGNAANNTLRGFGGDDLLDGGAGADTMSGGLGNDIYRVDNAGDVTTENSGEGIDTVRSYINWTLGANVERLELQGSGNLNRQRARQHAGRQFRQQYPQRRGRQRLHGWWRRQ